MNIIIMSAATATWNSLEIVKLITSVLTPLVLVFIGLWISGRLKRLDQLQWANQKLIEKRLSIFDEMAPALNDILCYFTYVGKWKELTPLEVIQIKRRLDRLAHIYTPVFDDQFLNKYKQFINCCFATHKGWTLDAKLCTDYDRRKESAGKSWRTEFESMFGEEVADLEEIKSTYSGLMSYLSQSVGIAAVQDKKVKVSEPTRTVPTDKPSIVMSDEQQGTTQESVAVQPQPAEQADGKLELEVSKISTGLLEVSGTIDLSQFWPKGNTDACKILVTVDEGGFRFRPNSKAPFQATKAFNGAAVTRYGRRKKVIDNNNCITVRLQGIDAPELAYRPSSHFNDRDGKQENQKGKYLEVNEEYRQPLAETATVRLYKFLAKEGRDPLPCVVKTAVNEPDEVFDIYGRFVGDIEVRIHGKNYNINCWLLQQGLAFPAFYNSMSQDEIESLTVAANQAYEKNRPIWTNLVDCVGNLDWNLQYRRLNQHPSYNASSDVGPVILPKLFRRLVIWEVNHYAGTITSEFRNYLESRNDECYLTDEFLKDPQGAQIYSLHQFVDNDGYFEQWPEDLVFRESPSRLTRPGGSTITW